MIETTTAAAAGAPSSAGFPIKRIVLSAISTIRRAATDETGGTSILLATAVPVVLGALGLGVDTGAWYIEKHRVQQIADSSALGGARAMASGQTLANAQAIAQRDATRNGYSGTGGQTIVINSPPTSGPYAGVKGAVEVVVKRNLPSLFSQIMLGSTARQVTGRAVAAAPPIQTKNLEVAMVLDASSSMDGMTELGVTKMEAQQTGATELLNTVIQANQSAYTSRVALAPFSSSVNVGAEYFKAVTNKNETGSWTGVVERPGTYKFSDEAPNATTKYFGDFKTKKAGVMGDYDFFVQSMLSQTPGATTKIAPLSTVKGNLKATINGMQSNGTTAAHIGLAWSWYMLSPKWSSIFTGSSAPNTYDDTKTYKAIVILSDFDFNSYYESGNGTANAQFEALCTQIKAAGIKIYTVGYNTTGTANNNRRVNCASPNKDDLVYSFTTTTASGLIEAFQTVAAQSVIGASELKLRLVE